ncbi:DUF1131 family protein [Martelella radicis]|uniref:Uncharacterized protein n=1 Tax=Martelella radicis TaxID=1397476 RepID=A0A7W6P8W3_9HYPH|nr:DUF1131 family protein [Martelella radicis]MBB4120731.1 hypothetical protein [Martelella radicis]
MNTGRTLKAWLVAGMALMAFGEAAPARDALLVVSESGLCGINGRTAFSEPAVRRALPGFDVRAEEREGEGGFYSVFIATDNGRDIVTLYGAETVVRADVAGTDAATDGGARIGDSFRTVYAGATERYCEPGMEVFSGRAVCLAPGSEQIALIFAGEATGPDDALPPGDELGGWRLEMIIWNAEF